MQLNDEQVGQWLLENPEFFNRHPELLREIQLTQPTTGQAVPLLQRQNEILRQHLAENHDYLLELIGNAKRNERLFQQVKALSLAVSATQTLPDLALCLRDQLVHFFEVDQACLLWFDEVQENAALKSGNQAAGLPDWHGHQALCGPATQHTLGQINRMAFGSDSQMQSLAVAPVFGVQQVLGLLVLGNHSPSHFRNSMDTLFLSYVASLAAVLAQRA